MSIQPNIQHSSDASQNRTSTQGTQNSMANQPTNAASTQRRIEESQMENSEDPFRTIRSLHEKQRGDPTRKPVGGPSSELSIVTVGQQKGVIEGN